jgi:hypothetical protein
MIRANGPAYLIRTIQEGGGDIRRERNDNPSAVFTNNIAQTTTAEGLSISSQQNELLSIML